MFNFTVVNLPSEGPYWAAFFTIKGVKYGVDKLYQSGEFWSCPADVSGNPTADIIAIELYDSSQHILPPSYGKNYQYGLTLSSNGSYRLNYALNTFETLVTKHFGNLVFATQNAVPKPGDSFYVDFSFSYQGGVSIGNTALKLALGQINLIGGFDTRTDPWFTSINLPDAPSPVKVSRQVLVSLPLDLAEGKYDASAEIGPLPWPSPESGIYIETRVRQFVTVSISGISERKFSNLKVAIKKAA